MSLKEYVVAIPSYKRPETLRDRSLKILKDHKIDKKKIFIFVSDTEQKKIYEDVLKDKYYNKIIVGVPGIKNIRNFMPKYFKEGQYIFYIDDDIYGVYDCINNGNRKNKSDNKLIKLKSLKDLINKGFKLIKSSGLTNWSVYPVYNPYFMKAKSNNYNDYISTKLCYIMGGFTGVVNNRKSEIRTIDDKEDYERSIKYYLKDNGVLRFNNISCDTKCYKEPGGMQVERTKQRIHDSAVYLTKEYPNLCTLNTTKKSGFTEVRMNDRRENKPNFTLSKSGTLIDNSSPMSPKLSKRRVRPSKRRVRPSRKKSLKSK